MPCSPFPLIVGGAALVVSSTITVVLAAGASLGYVLAVLAGSAPAALMPANVATVSAEEMAAWLGTIHYEVTTRINPLIPRVVVG